MKRLMFALVAVAAMRSARAEAIGDLASLRAALLDTSGFPDGSTITLAEATFDLGRDADPRPLVVTRPLTLVGTSRTGTVIDAGVVVRCLEITSADVVVSNLTLKGGFVSGVNDSAFGAGVCSTGARTTLADVDVRECYGHVSGVGTKSLGGVGVYFKETGCRLLGCRVMDCGGLLEGDATKGQCAYGGGVWCVNSDAVVRETLFRNCAMTNSSSGANSICVGAAYQGAYDGCAFVSNVAWRTAAATAIPDASAVFSASSVSRCHFLANHSTQYGAVYNVGDVRDSSFVRNVSSNGYGAALNSSKSPVAVRCLFDGNVSLRKDFNNYDKARGGAIGMEVGGSVTVSNCVFRRNEIRNSGKGGAIAGRNGSAVTAYGCVFDANGASAGSAICVDSGAKVSIERCLFTGEAVGLNKDSGALHVDLGNGNVAGYFLSVRNSLFREVDPSGGSVFRVLNGGTTARATFESCTMAGCKGTVFAFGSDNAASQTSLAGCCLYGNDAEGLSQVQDVAFCYLATDKAKDGANNLVSSADPGFVAYPSDLRIRRTSALVDAGGEARPWMGDGGRRGPQDMGDGTYSAGPSATFSVAGVRYECGANVVFGNANPRLVNGVPDIGAAEYRAIPGLMLLMR